jgi:glycosyltransferase involved in cell wall biosynthesis
MQLPLVTIGVPVRNQEISILNTLRSIDQQSYRNIEIIISDDFSSDSTTSLIRNFSWTNQTPKILEQKSNLGLYENLSFTLNQSRGTYFMWLAGDDEISPEFISNCVRFLESNPEYVAASCFPRYLTENGPIEGTCINLTGNLRNRIKNFLEISNIRHSHNIFYSLSRKDVISKCLEIEKSYVALDWSVDYFLVLSGNVKTDVEGYIQFGTKGVSRQPGVNRKFATRPIDLFLPYLRFTHYILCQTILKAPFEILQVITFAVNLNFVDFYERFRHQMKVTIGKLRLD